MGFMGNDEVPTCAWRCVNIDVQFYRAVVVVPLTGAGRR
jgi:hypothetical protein